MKTLPFLALLGLLLSTPGVASSPLDGDPRLRLHDDHDQVLELERPARRIVSLAPHITEILFAAGAGEYVVGAVSYSDYPEAARALPRVGAFNNVDLEAVAALRPDLVIAWSSGNRSVHLDRFEALGIPVYMNDARRLEDVARSIVQFGRLAGTEAVARQAAEDYLARRDTLARTYADRPPVRMFYQIWDNPLMTINGEHLISDVIRLCGGENVFADLPQLAPRIGAEAVLIAAPEAIVASGMGEARPEWLDRWREWSQLPAARHDNLYFVPPDIIQRHTPRILDGAAQLCAFLEEARAKRKLHSPHE